MSKSNPPLLITHYSSLITFTRRLDDEHGAARVAHDRLGGRAEEYAAQARPTVRRDDDQPDAALLGHAHDLRRRLAVRDHVLDFETGELLAARERRKLARRRLVQLRAEVRDRQRLAYGRPADGRDYRLDDVQADDARAQQARKLRRHRHGGARALPEVRRQQDGANFHKKVMSDE